MLPIPNTPNFINVDDGFTKEVVGGIDGMGVRKKPLTCRMGLPKGGVSLMFFMRGCFTLGLTLELLIFIKTGSNNERNSRSKTNMEIIKKNNKVKQRKRKIKENKMLLVLRKALPRAKASL